MRLVSVAVLELNIAAKDCSKTDWPNHKKDCTSSRRRNINPQHPEYDLQGAKTNEDISSHTSPLPEMQHSYMQSPRLLQALEEADVAKAIEASLAYPSFSSAADSMRDDPEEAGCEPRPAPDAFRGMQSALQRQSGSMDAEDKPLHWMGSPLLVWSVSDIEFISFYLIKSLMILSWESFDEHINQSTFFVGLLPECSYPETFFM
jgi:hypothetical protein